MDLIINLQALSEKLKLDTHTYNYVIFTYLQVYLLTYLLFGLLFRVRIVDCI